ncbi:peptidase family M1-domain-containing protein [Suillus paluster]|uniref:peptidase family M1-domain-containing protein n=1 Tax=Suillus paluster TaxID=48578 RepID=UPI001B879C16|nr:peptidase family M1-domain-containing protein [Suillus paluster]KAG1741787.1 peptidase family M1-domain-containing protein [Suillus paluster]
MMGAQDPTSQSNYYQISTKHFSLNWSIDFHEKLIKGSITHELSVHESDVKQVIFDTWDVVIKRVHVEGESGDAQYSLGEKHEVMGSGLYIPLPAGLQVGSSVKVTIEYNTTEPGCKALQWLDKAQTHGKTHPFLFSQCQPIYARSLLPCQDTPSVKVTYEAKITSVLPALMSAIRVSPPAEGPVHDGKIVGQDEVTYVYNQPVPIPSYLIAIASGNVCYRPFEKLEGKDWTSGVWAEPDVINDAWWEFKEDTTRFLAAEEELVGMPYHFGVYDLLVLPPSFPYGGMVPLLTGDRTLVDVVVHEITHSYFGNGITHADASHFWLNEGWTTYIERLLQQILHSPAHRGFSFLIGSKLLYDDLQFYEERNKKYQKLQIDFETGENPDDAYSGIPYEKGGNFLLHIERTLGGVDVFLPYVKDYVKTFMGKSITTDIWKEHLFGYYTQFGGDDELEALKSIDWDAWLFGTGVTLPVPMEYDMTLAQQSYKLAERWSKAKEPFEFDAADIDGMDANQIVVFLERLQSFDPLPVVHIDHLGVLYGLVNTPNAEIRLRFYQVALLDPKSAKAEQYATEALGWVVGDEDGMVKGRMKFCRPIFRAVFAVDKAMAQDTYQEHKSSFHPIARDLIEQVRDT